MQKGVLCADTMNRKRYYTYFSINTDCYIVRPIQKAEISKCSGKVNSRGRNPFQGALS